MKEKFFRLYPTPEETLIVWARQLNYLLGYVPAGSTQLAAINDPAGGLTVDAEARTAINSIIDALQEFNIVST